SHLANNAHLVLYIRQAHCRSLAGYRQGGHGSPEREQYSSLCSDIGSITEHRYFLVWIWLLWPSSNSYSWLTDNNRATYRDCKLCDAHRHTNFSERPLDGREDWNRCLHFNLGMPNRVVVADHLVQKTTPA